MADKQIVRNGNPPKQQPLPHRQQTAVRVAAAAAPAPKPSHHIPNEASVTAPDSPESDISTASKMSSRIERKELPGKCLVVRRSAPKKGVTKTEIRLVIYNETKKKEGLRKMEYLALMDASEMLADRLRDLETKGKRSGDQPDPAPCTAKAPEEKEVPVKKKERKRLPVVPSDSDDSSARRWTPSKPLKKEPAPAPSDLSDDSSQESAKPLRKPPPHAIRELPRVRSKEPVEPADAPRRPKKDLEPPKDEEPKGANEPSEPRKRKKDQEPPKDEEPKGKMEPSEPKRPKKDQEPPKDEEPRLTKEAGSKKKYQNPNAVEATIQYHANKKKLHDDRVKRNQSRRK